MSIGSDLSNRPLTALDKSLITSCTSLFALFASPLAGIAADVFGRKKIILLADLLFIIGAIWQALSARVGDMIAGRSIVGAAVGIASFVAPVYISELAPSVFRGRLVTIQCLLITFGQVVAYIVGWVFSRTDHGWRQMVGIGALPALVQIISVIFLPETPRWLVKAGQREEAVNVLRRTFEGSSNTGPSERQRESIIQCILNSVESEVQQEQEARHAGHPTYAGKRGLATRLDSIRYALTDLFSIGSNRRALSIACMLQGAQQLCGFNSLMYFSATIFALVGFRSPTLAALSIATTNFAFTLVAFYSIDRIGRRRILLASVPVMIIGLAVCGLAFRHLHFSAQSAEIEVPSTNGVWPGVILLSMVIYVASYAVGLGTVPWQQSELFPLPVRSLGSSLATATNWASNTVIGLTFLPMMEFLSPTGTFWLYAVICALCWVLIWGIYPETAGLGLEEISSLLKDDWAVRESVTQFAARRRRITQQQSQSERRN